MPSELTRFMAAVRSVESNGDYQAIGDQTRYGRPTGAYQFLDDTWDGYGGYRSAYLAPPEVQDRRARQLMSSYHREFGSWELVAVAWHAGPDTARQAMRDPSVPKRTTDGHITTAAYVNRVMNRANLHGGQSLQPWRLPRNLANADGRIIVDTAVLWRLAKQLTDHLATVDTAYHRCRRANADLERMHLTDATSARRLRAALDEAVDGRHGLRFIPGYLSRDIGYVIEARERATRADGDNQRERRSLERLIGSLAGGHGAGAQRHAATLLRDLYRPDRPHTRHHLPSAPGAVPRSLGDVTLGRAYGGTKSIFDQFVTPFMQRQGLQAGSQKRDHDTVRGPRESDHFDVRRDSYAVDYPTEAGADEAKALARAMGNRSWQPNSDDPFYVTVDGQQFRVQILWGSGVEHDNHIHVGIRRV